VAGTYRIKFETVSQDCLKKYCNYDPGLYSGTIQLVPNSQIPDEDWHEVAGRETGDPWRQYGQLKQWADQDREFVRNIRLEKMVSGPEWEVCGDQPG
jgi:hypothetical protein